MGFWIHGFLRSLSEIISKGSWNSQRVTWMTVTFPPHKTSHFAWYISNLLGALAFIWKTHLSFHKSSWLVSLDVFVLVFRTTPQSKIQSCEMIKFFWIEHVPPKPREFGVNISDIFGRKDVPETPPKKFHLIRWLNTLKDSWTVTGKRHRRWGLAPERAARITAKQWNYLCKGRFV